MIKKIIKKSSSGRTQENNRKAEEPEEELTLYDEVQLLEAEIADDGLEDDEDAPDSIEKAGAISPLKAIRKNCIQCIGSIREVPNCTASKSCPLYPFRMGKNPFRTVRVLTEEQKEAARLRFQKARDAKAKG